MHDDKTIKFTPRKHVYDTDHCTGCKKKIDESYKEVGLPNDDNTEIKHIVLCKNCYELALKHGVIFGQSDDG